MKVDRRSEAPPTRSRPKTDRFPEQLKKTGAPPAARAARPALARGATGLVPPLARVPPRGAFASAEHLGQVRQGASAEAHRLGDVRSEGQRGASERVHHRLGELLARELAREPTGPLPASEPTGPMPPSRPPSAPAPEAAGRPSGAFPTEVSGGAPATSASRAEATLALIERIEVFVKSQRPALALRLGGRLDATVELERTGPREVSLRIQGHRGPVPPEELARLREALAERGLALRALSST